MDELEKLYNEKLSRYKKMQNWRKTATQEEQRKYEKQTMQTIKECAQILNMLILTRQMTAEEIENGFTE